MRSTRPQMATRQLATEDFASMTPRGTIGRKSCLQTAELISTLSEAETRRPARGAEQLALLLPARGLSATNG